MNTLIHLFDKGSDIVNTENTDTMLIESFKGVMLEYPLKPSPLTLTISDIFGRPDLSQSERIQLGNRIEKWMNRIVEIHPITHSIKGKESNLWMNTETKKVVVGGNGAGLKDIDNLFSIVKSAYYLEIKTNLNLDTEKAPATIEKVKIITECLKESGNYDEVIGKVVSPFWDSENVPISGNMKKYASIMWFSEFSKLLDLGLTKETYEDLCKKIGKFL